MSEFEQRKETALDEMLRMQMELLINLQQFKDTEEYKTINMNMTTVCRELNNLRIKQITNMQEGE